MGERLDLYQGEWNLVLFVYYLCIIMDLFSRKIIAWNLSSKSNAELVTTTFQKAYTSRNSPQGLMFHSDRGTQYTAMSFRLDSHGVVQSFSKIGYPFDNACCESFFKYLKKEECHRRNYHTKKRIRTLNISIHWRILQLKETSWFIRTHES